MAFFEVRVNDGLIVYGTEGGAEYSTKIVTLYSGFEQSNQNWVGGRGQWNLGDRVVVQSEADTLNTLFRTMKGKANAFRFKDWLDYKDGGSGVLATTTTGAPINIGTGNGNSVYQLFKTYTSGAAFDYRAIRKPVAGTVKVFRNGSPAIVGGGLGNIAIDTITGQITFVNDLSASINAITNANPGVVSTVAAHGLTSGQSVFINGVAGMTQVNNINHVATVLTSSSFSIENTTTYGAYTTGGTVQKFPQLVDTLTAQFEYDVPVRFDTDKFMARFDAANISSPGTVAGGYYYIARLPIIEIRV